LVVCPSHSKGLEGQMLRPDTRLIYLSYHNFRQPFHGNAANFVTIIHRSAKKESGMHFDEWLLLTSVLLLLSIFAWKVSSRLGIPALLLFLGIGMLAGSDGPGGIYFDDALLAQSVGVVALAFILFAGGLETDWKVVRPVLGGALSLSTIGVLLTAVIVAIFALIVLHFSFAEGL